MTEEQKDKLFSEHLCYLGKVLKKAGTRKNKETEEEINWKLWGLNFDSGESKQYDWQCSIFGNYDKENKPLACKGIHVANMEEGKYYEIVYKWNEYQHQEYGPKKSKQAVLIKESSKENSTQDTLGNKQSTGTEQPKKVAAEGFVEFAKEYKETMEKAGKEASSIHMLGAYVANKHQEQFGDIITLCKKEFEKKEIEV